jgi:nucleoside-diphosphate-sugar epimerase
VSPAAGGVLLLGATGRTGGRVLTQLLGRGVPVRAIVRSAERLPAGAAADPLLTVVEAEVASMPVAELREHVAGRDAVVCCLGHTISLRGVFGPPRDLVERAVRSVCAAVDDVRPASPARLVLMSSVSVNRPARADARRGAGERAYMAVLRALLPPARDNQCAADFLAHEVGAGHPSVSWVVVRPDALVDGELSEYRTHEGSVASLFRPATTRMASVAHFMAELATGGDAWRRWRGEMPVIVDGGVVAGGGPGTREGERRPEADRPPGPGLERSTSRTCAWRAAPRCWSTPAIP